MIILFLCILSNVFMAVIFVYFKKFRVDNLYAIIVNYLVCVLAASFFLGETAIPLDLIWRPWFWCAVVLGILFIGGLNILGLSFQKSGVALTAIIQKMSLIIPAAFAISLYGEVLTLMKGFGILLALTAVILVYLPEKDSSGVRISLSREVLILPLLTFILSGMIEIILFYVEAEGLLGDDIMKFCASSFGIAGILGLFASVYLLIKGKTGFTTKDFVGGIILGVPNFMTIYLLLVLLGQGWDGSVLFPVNNIGILILISLIGFVLFSEKVTKLKIIGILLGVLAILFVGMGA